MKGDKRIIDQIGICMAKVCDFESYHEKDIVGKSRYHAESTGHEVVVRQTVSIVYQGERVHDDLVVPDDEQIYQDEWEKRQDEGLD